MTPSAERGVWLPENMRNAKPRDLRRTCAPTRRHRRDPAATPLPRCAGGLGRNGFRRVASRVVAGTVRPPDISAGADELLRGLARQARPHVDPGFPMDSAWRGALPPDSSFVHIDDVPATVVLDLAQRGAEVSKEQGAQGPPVSLLDQEVIHVSGADASRGTCAHALCIRFDGNGFCRLTSRRRDGAGPHGRRMAARRRTLRLGVLPPDAGVVGLAAARPTRPRRRVAACRRQPAR